VFLDPVAMVAFRVVVQCHQLAKQKGSSLLVSVRKESITIMKYADHTRICSELISFFGNMRVLDGGVASTQLQRGQTITLVRSGASPTTRSLAVSQTLQTRFSHATRRRCVLRSAGLLAVPAFDQLTSLGQIHNVVDRFFRTSTDSIRSSFSVACAAA
jgi:hypothetical protein